ncbi:MAG: TIGR02530 family flagellar biosynthesis protein [bacterium]
MVAKTYGPQFQKPQQVTQPGIQKPLQPQPTAVRTEFQRILEEQSARTNGVSFSAHAAKRVEQRQISMTPDDFMRLANAVDKAAGKGARESLVLLDDLALIVSVTNRKVITAMDVEKMKENVITNIDSAVLA